ncbi:MAG TPA: hypothetical protein EYH06_05140 [Chromatiales bacterium]|nr:hypothetical protein [Thiotrichales bacterium]HIP67962.1 hypothetical protein [Chromatiales bacterium]
MNEETFNMSIRKFLKKVGINSQREIEQSVRGLLAEGKLQGNETLTVKAVLSLEGREDVWTIEDKIKLE